jgi:hypothetical protein
MLYQDYSGSKDCFFVEDARHVESMYVDPQGYAHHLDAMIINYIS